MGPYHKIKHVYFISKRQTTLSSRIELLPQGLLFIKLPRFPVVLNTLMHNGSYEDLKRGGKGDNAMQVKSYREILFCLFFAVLSSYNIILPIA
jgi:hypothetical protein